MKKSHIVIVLFAITASILVFHFGRIVDGYCFEQRRWLPESELFDIAMRHVFENYPPQRFGIPGTFHKEIDEPIVYEDFVDFVLRNPDCCQMSETGWQGMTVGFVRRLRGYSRGFVRVEYAADPEGLTDEDISYILSKYTVYDESDVKNFNKKNLSFVPVSNCGKVWRGY